MISKTELKSYNFILYFPILGFIIIFFPKLFYNIVCYTYPTSTTPNPWDFNFMKFSVYGQYELNWGYFIIGFLLFLLFLQSCSSINKLLRGENSKLFISLAKCAVGCSLIGVYLGFLFIRAQSRNDLANNIIVLITSLFFFIDGLHDVYDFIKSKKADFDINTIYEGKRALKFQIIYLIIFDAITPICIISSIYGYAFMDENHFNWIPIVMQFVLITCLFFDLCIINFTSIFIPIIGNKESPNKTDLYDIIFDEDSNKSKFFKYFSYLFPVILFLLFIYKLHDLYISNYLNIYSIILILPLLLLGLSIISCRHIRKSLFHKLFDKICLEINFTDAKSINIDEKKYYFTNYINLCNSDILLCDLESTNCFWYDIANQKDKFLGKSFILNKDNKSYLFVFITKCHRGKGVGTIALKQLELMPEVKHNDMYIELKDNIKNIDLIKIMLTKNGYSEI